MHCLNCEEELDPLDQDLVPVNTPRVEDAEASSARWRRCLKHVSFASWMFCGRICGASKYQSIYTGNFGVTVPTAAVLRL
jgi:hypothetical protein